MGRKLMRVPLDFNWPMNKVWKHYLNPFYNRRAECVACGGTGYAPEARRFRAEWYGHVNFDPVAYGATPLTADHPKIRERAARNVKRSPDFYTTSEEKRARRTRLLEMEVDLPELHLGPQLSHEHKEGLVPFQPYLKSAIDRETQRLFDLFRNQWKHHLIQADVDALVEAERLWDFTRTPRTEEQRKIVRQKIAAGGNSWLPESNGYQPTAQEVNDWSIDGFGHDGCNASVCIRARCAREGVEVTCPKCEGEGHTWPDPEDKQLYDVWKPSDPPEGPGYQLWETTSEGSPVSPVFITLDELCGWAEKNVSTFANYKTTAERWKQMLADDFVYHAEGNAIFL